jgi:hypothetical protein
MLNDNMAFYIGGEGGITTGVLPSAPSGPHFVRSNSLQANLSNRGSNQILTTRNK